MNYLSEYFSAVVSVLASLAPFLLLGAAVAGLLHVLLPKNFVRRHLAGHGGVLKAVLLGVPLPLCSCGVIPAGLGLKKDGASDASTVGFLISTPQTGIDSILVSASFLGLPFALFKVVSATATGLIGGYVTGWVSSSSPDAVAPIDDARETDSRVRRFFDHALMILGSIWGWLVFGVLISAAIETFVPEGFLAGIGQHGVLIPMLIVLVVSLPLYVCATASVPIAAALVAAGMPAGAALVFLMAGPATNVATIGAIYRTLGKRPLIVYLATIIIGSVGFGVLFDFVLPIDAVAPVHEHGALTWWTITSIIVLVALIAYFAVRDLIGAFRKRWPVSVEGDSVAVDVSGMTCGGCASKLERTLRAKEGVAQVDVSLDPGRVVVFGSLTYDALVAGVEEAGFTPARR